MNKALRHINKHIFLTTLACPAQGWMLRKKPHRAKPSVPAKTPRESGAADPEEAAPDAVPADVPNAPTSAPGA